MEEARGEGSGANVRRKLESSSFSKQVFFSFLFFLILIIEGVIIVPTEIERSSVGEREPTQKGHVISFRVCLG